MAELDFYLKRLLRDRERFADLYNAEVFHGRQVLCAGDLSDGAEFLSHIKKTDRIMPIINLVLYCGKTPWDGPKSLYDMMGIDETWHVKV